MRTGLGLGSNLGDRLARLREARERIRHLPGVRDPLVSAPVFESDPVGCDPGSPPFLNTVLELEYEGHPVTLLDALLALEVQLGRPSKHPRNAARAIDLDVLYAGNLALRNEEIVIPHPRLHQRRFVLAPLAAIAPDRILPGGERTIAELLAALLDPAGVTLVQEEW